MAGAPPVLPGDNTGDTTVVATKDPSPPPTHTEASPVATTTTTVTVLTIDLPANDDAMVKLFGRLFALKGAASLFVLDKGIASLAPIHDLDDNDIESLCKLYRKPKPGHPVALCVET